MKQETNLDYPNQSALIASAQAQAIHQDRAKNMYKLGFDEAEIKLNINGKLVDGLNGYKRVIPFSQTIKVYEPGEHYITFNENSEDDNKNNKGISILVDNILEKLTNYDPLWQNPEGKIALFKRDNFDLMLGYLITTGKALSPSLVRSIASNKEEVNSLIHGQGWMVVKPIFPIDKYLR